MNKSENPHPPLRHEAADQVEATTVLVNVRSVYGNELVYPANSPANSFCELTRKSTLSASDLEIIRELGFRVAVQTPALPSWSR
jgi:hypothetical protein